MLRKYIDKIKPHFEKGGKFEKLHSTFEAFESFLFVPDTVTRQGTHIRDAIDLKRAMSVVIIALIPAMLFGMWNVGYQQAESLGVVRSLMENFRFGFLHVFPVIVVSYVVGLGIEFGVAQVRGHEVNEGFLVSGMLIPLIMPVGIPLWMVAVATAFSVVFVKEILGGTGMNIWNPALVARAFLFFAYPSEISGDMVWVSGVNEAGVQLADAFSGATPLAQAAAGHPFTASLSDMFIGIIPGCIGETSTLAILIGAALLLFTGIGSWRIMLSVFAGGAVTGLLFNLWNANSYMALPFYYHFVMGGFAFGAVFMATDPVSATHTSTGKFIYGFLIGFFAVLIRVLNPAYPEGMMLAILLMNTFAPLVDHCVIQVNIGRRMKRMKQPEPVRN
ncbi:MAG: NADH:ubiquinone reductase (Na(+)-transporting) subunit B [Bacteroidales bacterium]|jgi:Na+-transporting NADH:ubiquinone oxidoreductase subunit B|nr:NADH:ubiquinone reductase (Na(+)-transporting) subunit B [Bacteroidales bacterium]